MFSPSALISKTLKAPKYLRPIVFPGAAPQKPSESLS